VRALRILVLVLGVAHVGLFLVVVSARFAYPVDAEWMTGSVRDAVLRVKAGLPVYGPPSAEYVAFLYPPLYYWAAAFASRFTSTFVACKVVSIASTAVAGAAVGRLARSLGADRFWTAAAVLLHAAAFSLTLFFYDLERVDPLGSALVASGVAVLLGGGAASERGERDGLVRAALGGGLLGLSFFAKQPGLFAFAGALGGLTLAREKRRLVAFGAAGVVVLLGGSAYLEATTHGWWRYYCLELPGSHGIEPALVSVFFITDLPKAFVLAGGSVALVAWQVQAWLTRRRSEAGSASEARPASDWRDVVFAVLLVALLAASFSLRAHRGGWSNVLLAWTPLGCAAAGVAATRVIAKARAAGSGTLVEAGVLGLVLLQLLGLVFDPNDLAPGPEDVQARARLQGIVRELEREGDVVVTPVGNLTRAMHFHSAALFDVLRAGHPAPPDYLEGLRARKYAALFVDAPFEVHCKQRGCRDIDEAMAQNYFVACRLEEHEHTGMAGFDARPRWILRPRKTPLPGGDWPALQQRRRVEMGLAAMREQGRGKGATPAVDDAIEAIAASPDPRWDAAPR
jgi:hypothetical protein